MNREPAPVVFLAPGAGLGHLVRCTALALELRRRGCRSTIVTSSIWAEGMSRLTGVDIIELPVSRWRRQVRRCQQELRPRLLVLDTFPLGFRGEWLAKPPADCITVYLARRLQIDAYLSAIGATGVGLAVADRALVIEPLTREHQDLLQNSVADIRVLPGRVRLPWDHFDTPKPPELVELLASGRLRLVVHSGPQPETQQLIDRARKDRKSGDEPMAVISPNPSFNSPPSSIEERYPCFDYFPAASLFSQALHVYTGAGYNSIAEGAAFPEKHTSIAFERRYDDQHGRRASSCPPRDATEEAVSILVEWLD